MHRSPVFLSRAGDEILLLGQPLFRGTARDLLNALQRALQSGTPELIVTPNVDQLIELETNPELRRAYSAAALRLVDGAPLRALCSALGGRGVERHTGADLLPLVTSAARERGWKVGIAGGQPGVAEEAATRLGRNRPNQVFAIQFPHLTSTAGDRASERAIKAVTAAKADIVFLCLGSPKQELWFLEHRDALPPGLYIGAGAAVDFAAGRARRAPEWVQQLSAEWLWRFAQEPRRLFRRYFIRGPRFFFIAARSLRSRRS